jgi:hypothetical protein
MYRFAKKILFCLCLCLTSLSYAWVPSSLSITNNIKSFEVDITADLLCGYFFGFSRESAQYTSPLDENPIQANAVATWQNCTVADLYFTADAHGQNDHSKIYVTFKDLANNAYAVAVLTVYRGQSTKSIYFQGKNITILMSHSGDYDAQYGKWVSSTKTSLDINES